MRVWRSQLACFIGFIAGVLALPACDVSATDVAHHTRNGVGLDAPTAWTVTNFSVDTTPRRLIVASYDVTDADVEGDCGGAAAIERLPRDGAFLLLVDYGAMSAALDRDDFRKSAPAYGRDEPFDMRRFSHFECFGPSYVFLFVVAGHALQAHIGLGADAASERRQEVTAVLNSITVEP